MNNRYLNRQSEKLYPPGRTELFKDFFLMISMVIFGVVAESQVLSSKDFSATSLRHTPGNLSSPGPINNENFPFLTPLTVLKDGEAFRLASGNNVVTPKVGSVSTDYFKSLTNGMWHSAASWQSSADGITGWNNATLYPDKFAKGIEILNGHTITQTANATATYLKIAAGGILTSDYSGYGVSELSITDDGTAKSDFDIYGTYIIFGKSTTFNSGATGVVYTNGIVKVDLNDGGNADKFASTLPVVFKTGSVFDWNTTNTFNTSGVTYFPNELSQIPTFKISQNPSNPGETTALTINGILQVNADVTFIKAGSKTFRNGITGSATITQNSGSFIIGGNNAIIGGRDLKIILSSPLNLTTSVTVPKDSSVKISGRNINNASTPVKNIFTINGTLDATEISFSPSDSVSINGILKTGNVFGIKGTSSTFLSSGFSISDGSTIEFYSPLPQMIETSRDYYNITFKGGTKTFTSTSVVKVHTDGIVTISGPLVYIDATNNNLGLTIANNTRFNMDGGTLILGRPGAQPNMDGTYNITGGKIVFAGSGQTIRSKKFNNIDVTGTDVGTSGGYITLNPVSSFVVKSSAVFRINVNGLKGTDALPTASVKVENGATFKTGNLLGFHGLTAGAGVDYQVSSIHPNISNNIILEPGSTVEYTRPSPLILADQQITNSLNFAYQNLALSGRGNKIAPSDSLSIIGNFIKSGAAVFVHNSGKIAFNGTALQNYYSSAPQVGFNNFTNNNITAAGLVINDSMAVYKEMFLKSGSRMTLRDTVTLKSNANNTANISKIMNADAIMYSTGTTTNGSFIVERYMLVSKKAWHMLSRPAKGSTIQESWQEGNSTPFANSKPGYGITITTNLLPDPTPLGFDGWSTMPSVKTYEGDRYISIPATTGTSASRKDQQGYFVFVRGDRSVLGGGSGGPTTLRTKGRIYSPGIGEEPAQVQVPAGKFAMVGNPYPSAIKFDKTIRSNLQEFYYIWDPRLTGDFNTGAFRTLSADGSVYVPMDPDAAAYPDVIESGQAFFVESSGLTGTINFSEAAKVPGSGTRAFSFAKDSPGENDAQIRANIYSFSNGTRELLDGVLTQFGSENSNELDAYDGRKLEIETESMGILKGGEIIVIGSRAMPLITDTIFYDFKNLKIRDYELQLIPGQMEITGMMPYLKDRYLNTDQKLFSGINTINIKIENIAPSRANDRFYVYFKPATPTPVTLLSFNASQNNGDIIVKWKVENEKDMHEYTVEVSADAIRFNNAGVIPSLNLNAGGYQWTDVSVTPGIHYYRLKMTSKDGKISHSSIVRVLIGNDHRKSMIAIYPNPIINNEWRVHLDNQPAGLYKAKLLNDLGQFMHSIDFNHAGGSSIEVLPLKNKLATGMYYLEISRSGEKVFIGKILVQ